MNFSQCPDEFQIEEQKFTTIPQRSSLSTFNFENLESKYKFTYPVNLKQNDIKRNQLNQTPPQQTRQLQQFEIDQNSKQQIEIPAQLSKSAKQPCSFREQGKIQLHKKQIEQPQREIKSILNFQVDTKFINVKPSKKKNQKPILPQFEQQQIQKRPFMIQNNPKYKKISPNNRNRSPIKKNINQDIFEISFHQETKVNKFQQLLNKAPKQIEIDQHKSLKWFGNKELCEGELNGMMVQFIKTEKSNVIL
ncbi:unnamed protein product [Paramecium sonneborni]|uniref:Uncharacterized protein n=1 Tax=Paramecium sonneborni TaxID=65129 RepID=A0A8S1QGH9_9CILI|nr:unnamed protein product [Paramecium sonneborni]